MEGRLPPHPRFPRYILATCIAPQPTWSEALTERTFLLQAPGDGALLTNLAGPIPHPVKKVAAAQTAPNRATSANHAFGSLPAARSDATSVMGTAGVMVQAAVAANARTQLSTNLSGGRVIAVLCPSLRKIGLVTILGGEPFTPMFSSP